MPNTLPTSRFPACCLAPYSQVRTRTQKSCAMTSRRRSRPPGVHAVVTGEDCPNALMGPLIKDEHAIAKSKVRYIGEPVAAVAAENEAAGARGGAADRSRIRGAAGGARRRKRRLPLARRSSTKISRRYFKVFDAGSNGNICSRTSYQEGDPTPPGHAAMSLWRIRFAPKRRRISRSSRAERWPISTRPGGSRSGPPISRYSASRPTSARASRCRCRGYAVSRRASAAASATRWKRTSSRSRSCSRSRRDARSSSSSRARRISKWCGSAMPLRSA